MIHAQNEKTAVLIHPVSGSAGATYAATFDTLGYDYAMITVLLATTGTSASDNPSVMAVGEGDTSSSFTNISGLVGDTDFTIPLASNATNKMQVNLGINTKGRKRYLQFSQTLGAACLNAAVVKLSRASETPTTAAQLGVDLQVLV